MSSVDRRDFLSTTAVSAIAPILEGIAFPASNTEQEFKTEINRYWGFSHNDAPRPEKSLHSALGKQASLDRHQENLSTSAKAVQFIANRIDCNYLSEAVSLLNHTTFPDPDRVNDRFGWDARTGTISLKAREAFREFALPLVQAINTYTENVTDWARNFGQEKATQEQAA